FLCLIECHLLWPDMDVSPATIAVGQKTTPVVAGAGLISVIDTARRNGRARHPFHFKSFCISSRMRSLVRFSRMCPLVKPCLFSTTAYGARGTAYLPTSGSSPA